MNNIQNISDDTDINNLFWYLLCKIERLSQKDKIQINHYFKRADTSKKMVALIIVKDYIFSQESKGKVKCLKDQSHFWGMKY